eukprot:CAMPEP_0185701398 /NCGR_PEP_ID=MMETSP1164-20130828/9269_1 /TAXON_ID=1104430 /ORGANISM="Chrysoreinhardia sp, Strain CCMP2950" /LENGTH=122 /DNA_ID=CAMNT_0028368443 /DNA_START=71 /DNA_END=439 /DNA_ORIENTATION=+
MAPLLARAGLLVLLAACTATADRPQRSLLPGSPETTALSFHLDECAGPCAGIDCAAMPAACEQLRAMTPSCECDRTPTSNPGAAEAPRGRKTEAQADARRFLRGAPRVIVRTPDLAEPAASS